jgi:hypothetical protein
MRNQLKERVAIAGVGCSRFGDLPCEGLRDQDGDAPARGWRAAVKPGP